MQVLDSLYAGSLRSVWGLPRTGRPPMITSTHHHHTRPPYRALYSPPNSNRNRPRHQGRAGAPGVGVAACFNHKHRDPTTAASRSSPTSLTIKQQPTYSQSLPTHECLPKIHPWLANRWPEGFGRNPPLAASGASAESSCGPVVGVGSIFRRPASSLI